MPIQTYVEGGELVGFVPTLGLEARVPLREILAEASRVSGVQLSDSEIGALDTYTGDTVIGGIEEVGAGKIARKLGKFVKKVAKNKIVKAIVKVARKAVPPPFNVAVNAAHGAAKFGAALVKGSKKQKAKAKKVLPAVRKAAAGQISSKQLVRAAKKAKVKPAIAMDAAVMKRVAMDARTNPKAAATLRLADDIVSTEPAAQARAAQALESEYHEPTTSRDSGEDQGMEPAPLYEEATPPDDQAPMTEDPYGPDHVEPFEVDDGSTDAVEETVEGFGYY